MRFYKVGKKPVLLLLFLLVLFIAVHHHNFTIQTKTDTGSLEAAIKFKFPVKLAKPSTKLYPQYPLHSPHWSVEQTKANVISLKVQESMPYGQPLKLSLGYHPLGLPLTLHIGKTLVNDVPPKLVGAERKVVSSDKPIVFQFNTFIDPKSIKHGINTSIPGYFKPTDWHQSNIKNYSRWQFVPNRPLTENQSFKVTFKPNILSANGKNLDKEIVYHIITAVKPKYDSGNVIDNSQNISLYPELKFSYDRELNKADIVLKEANTGHLIRGKVKLAHNTASFTPDNILLPATKYLLTVKVQSSEKATSDPLKLHFTTEEVSGKYWVDVKLGDIHTVTVYQGQYPIRIMLASGGRSGHETPLGKYYTQDRGNSFWAARFGEGATYWVRIVGSILIHSVPKDANWQTKEEEHAKLGLPASHGCIRLSEQDAKWVYENLPSNTIIIIHN